MSALQSRTNQVVVTDDDQHAILAIVALFLLVVSLMSVLARLFTKKFAIGILGKDDLSILISLAFSVAQSIAIVVATERGLGMRWDQLSDDQRLSFDKSFYTSELLYIPTIFFTKLSIVLFIRGLSPLNTGYNIPLAAQIGLLVWAISSLFAASFQCASPRIWNISGDSCYDIKAFWTYFNVTNILTDLFLILWPSFIIWKLQTAWHRKIIVLLCFLSRLIVVGAEIAQLYYLSSDDIGTDPTFNLFPGVVTNQLVVVIGIATACIPCMKLFFDSINSGLTRSDDIRRKTTLPNLLNKSSSTPYKARSQQTESGNGGNTQDSLHLTSWYEPTSKTHTQITTKPGSWDGASADSRAQFITKETTIYVSSD